jgi:hypothetical protein
MGAGGQFRHHAPERAMGFVLRCDALGQDDAIPAHEGDCGFIAAGFNA